MSFTDLLALLVVRHKVMTLTEFYAADVFDLDVVCEHLQEAERDASERMRHMMWAMLAPNSKKKIMPEDVLTFSWEKGGRAAPEITTKEMFEKVFKNYKKL